MIKVLVGIETEIKKQVPREKFIKSRTYKTFLTWLWYLEVDIEEVIILKTFEVEGFLAQTPQNETYKFIAFGPKASKVLLECGVRHFTLPHPKGHLYGVDQGHLIRTRLKECLDFTNQEI